MRFDLSLHNKKGTSDGERDVFLTGIQGHWYSSTVLPGLEIMKTSRRPGVSPRLGGFNTKEDV